MMASAMKIGSFDSDPEEISLLQLSPGVYHDYRMSTLAGEGYISISSSVTERKHDRNWQNISQSAAFAKRTFRRDRSPYFQMATYPYHTSKFSVGSQLSTAKNRE